MQKKKNNISKGSFMAKKTQNAKLTVVNAKLDQFKGDILAIGLFKNTTKLPAVYESLDRQTGGLIARTLKLGDASGEANQITVLYMPEKMSFKRLLIVGLGEAKDSKLNTLRQASGSAARIAAKLKASSLGLAMHVLLDESLTLESAGQALAEGALYALYNFSEFMSESSASTLQNIALVSPIAKDVDRLKKGFIVGSIIAESQNYSRNLTNLPGNVVNPPVLAAEAKKVARTFGLKCKVFDEKQLAKMGMNAILAVGSGSASKPRFIVLEYNGKKSAAKKSARPDAVVIGKGVTFDSGGLSIKPGDSMLTMKNDKAGACDVLGIMSALARLKLPLHVFCLIPTVENLPSSTSYRPDDIIRTAAGKTVEIISTDAEGRLILADALHYATHLKPAAIIDIATLTGGCVIALGSDRAGLFGNDPSLIDRVNAAAETAGEPLWPMPCGSEYLDKIKSKVADLKNTGGREGSACTAAAFLRQFAENIPWTHLDIAGTDTYTDEKSWRSTGATGFGVRIVLQYLRSL
jgi:leucyl aminopeptidase